MRTDNRRRRQRRSLVITEVSFIRSSPEERADGLLGYLSCVIDNTLILDRIMLRRTLKHQLRLSFPRHADSCGRLHYIICPLDDVARRDFELRVLRQVPQSEITP